MEQEGLNQGGRFKGRYKEKLTNEDAETSSSTCRLEINTTTHDDHILIGQKTEKWNQENTKIPLPGIKKRSGSSELQIAVPRQERRKIEKGQKTSNIWINQCFQEFFLRPPFSLAFIMQGPFNYLYNPQNHYIMAETRKSKDDKRTTLKKKSKEKLTSSAINLQPKKMITDGKPEINNAEKNSSKLSHKSELFKKPNDTSEPNLEFNNSQITMEMDSRIDDKDLMNSKETNNEATFWKDNPNTDSKMRSKEFSDNTSPCINTSNMDLMLFLNNFKDGSNKDEWSTNCSQNNAKKPVKKGGKKGKDSDLDSGDSKDAKKEGKKREKKEPRKKKDTESTGGESGDSKDAKKESKKDKKEKKEVKKKKDTDSIDAESGDSQDSKKDKKEKNADKKGSESTDVESVDSKGAKKEKRRSKKDDMKDAFYTDSESDAETKKDKRDEMKENKGNRNKLIKDTLSTDADSESESDPTIKKGEKKDKKITKKGEKKDAQKTVDSTASESEIEVKEKKEVMKDSAKDIGSYTDSASDGSSKAGIRRGVRLSGTESEGSLVFKVIKTTDDSDGTSTDSKKLTSEQKRGFRASSKKTTFRERGERDMGGRIPSSRERLPFPPCEPLQTSPKPKRVCQCKVPPPPPKPRYAPLPEAKWIHKLL
ncbi:cylicin-1 [Arvicola amphibius]|uniref:cylicin-1 n=1 Tax=Arvicola amphibius TaxID=1047088 RepID=UPI001C0980C9|nr:cylicin-1 [Arvicola amphibius]